MAIPFRDAAELERLGAAGFLRVRPDGVEGAWRAALFLTNARGEPLDFAYNRIRLPQRFLWRAPDAAAYAARRLAASLFEVCPRAPVLLLALAQETAPALFTRELDLAVPAARLAGAGTPPAAGEDAEDVTDAEEGGGVGALRLLWAGRAPPAEHAARLLLLQLSQRGLLAEPFDRAEAGLVEVYGLLGGAGEGDDDELVAGAPER